MGDSGDILSAPDFDELVFELETASTREKLDMNEGAAKILQFERRVMWRKRLLSLQDALVLTVMLSGLITAAFLILARLRPVSVRWWIAVIVTVGLVLVTLLIRWYLTRVRQDDAAFLIDESLTLDDRIATSQMIIERGGPTGAIEAALIEDAATRIGGKQAASIVPFRAHRWYALSLVSIAAVAAALMIPGRSMPADQPLAAERADVESAGEQLEQSATEIEQAVPGTETSALATEQAEIGRGFRRALATRSEALRRLSALEERIRKRHDDLTSTRADEIVSLADRRLGETLSSQSAKRPSTADSEQSLLSRSSDEPRDAKSDVVKGDRQSSSTEREDTAGGGNKKSATSTRSRDGHPANTARAHRETQAERQKRLQEPDASKPPGSGLTQPEPTNSNARASETGRESANSSDKKGDAQKPGNAATDAPRPGGEKTAEPNTDERKADQQPAQPPAGSLDALKAVPESIASQAAKAIPNISEELLKKAAELRANRLSPQDIEKLRKAAEFLARDLSNIAQSEQLKKTLEEMTRQVRPEQIEQVARELASHEKLKQELEAAARLLSENQQAKETVAGLAGQIRRMQDPVGQTGNNRRGDPATDPGARSNRADAQSFPSSRAGRGGVPENVEKADNRFAGQGRESSLKGGKLQGRAGGEYLYLQSKAGVGAARAPYSSAYPQYRREAERTVRRSQVPPNLRSVVRKYFDAINPDAKKQ